MMATEAVATFAATFERWSRGLMATDAPSLPRMRLLYTPHCQGPQRMGDLADALEVTPRSVTALVDGLEAEGMVRRMPDPSDRRATIVESTGAFDAEAGYETHAQAVAALFGTLSPADRSELLRLSRALIERMHAASRQAS